MRNSTPTTNRRQRSRSFHHAHDDGKHPATQFQRFLAYDFEILEDPHFAYIRPVWYGFVSLRIIHTNKHSYNDSYNLSSLTIMSLSRFFYEPFYSLSDFDRLFDEAFNARTDNTRARGQVTEGNESNGTRRLALRPRYAYDPYVYPSRLN